MRVPGPDQHFLTSPFGLHFSEITASDLLKIDLDCRIIGTSGYPATPADFRFHSAIHSGIDEAHCVMHTHTTAGCAVAGSQCGLSGDNFYAAQLYGRVAYHDFEGNTLHADAGAPVVHSIGRAQAVILRNHGLLSWGQSIPEAFAYLWTLQRACEIQVAGAVLGPTIAIPGHIQRRAAYDAIQFDPRQGAERAIFEALSRILDSELARSIIDPKNQQ